METVSTGVSAIGPIIGPTSQPDQKRVIAERNRRRLLFCLLVFQSVIDIGVLFLLGYHVLEWLYKIITYAW